MLIFILLGFIILDQQVAGSTHETFQLYETACACLCACLRSTLFAIRMKGSGHAMSEEGCLLAQLCRKQQQQRKKYGLRRHMRTRRKKWGRASAGRGEPDRLSKVGERD